MAKKVAKKANGNVFIKVAVYQEEIMRKLDEMIEIAKDIHRERHAFLLRYGMKVCDTGVECC